MIVYLLAHGILKLGIAIGLFRERTEWIFPVGSAVLVGFIVYMAPAFPCIGPIGFSPSRCSTR
jgi:uncharacterized membrane protein